MQESIDTRRGTGLGGKEHEFGGTDKWRVQ